MYVCKEVNRQQQLCKDKRKTKNTNNNKVNDLFTFIEISHRQKHSPSSAFIRLLILQARAGNRNTERIQSVLCEVTLRVKRIIMV